MELDCCMYEGELLTKLAWELDLIILHIKI